MGNWFARKYLAVHPTDQDGEDIVKSSLITPSSSSLRIKVRMTTTQLEELMALADLSQGSSDLGRVILQECLDGRFRARVVVGDEGLLSSEYARNLYTIKEEQNGLVSYHNKMDRIVCLLVCMSCVACSLGLFLVLIN
ncbi:hypothetical protein NC652_006916 [Populus alba x Populus x berolinensis]|nr:hypothetical protein NC652_006916 [Populus alba x Populus x berolinensis]